VSTASLLPAWISTESIQRAGTPHQKHVAWQGEASECSRLQFPRVSDAWMMRDQVECCGLAEAPLQYDRLSTILTEVTFFSFHLRHLLLGAGFRSGCALTWTASDDAALDSASATHGAVSCRTDPLPAAAAPTATRPAGSGCPFVSPTWNRSSTTRTTWT